MSTLAVVLMTGPATISWTTRALDAAVDLTKQLITLATGVLTLTLTFFNNVFAKPAGQTLDIPVLAKWVLSFAWGLLILSILGGLLVLSAFTGTQARAGVDAAKPANANDAGPRFFAKGQWIAFVAGLFLVAFAGVIALVVS